MVRRLRVLALCVGLAWAPAVSAATAIEGTDAAMSVRKMLLMK